MLVSKYIYEGLMISCSRPEIWGRGKTAKLVGIDDIHIHIYMIFNQKPINRLAPLIGTGVFVDLYHYC